MKIVVIGPGALGSLLSARLATGGQTVTLLDRHTERAAALANRLTLITAKDNLDVSLTITADPACLDKADLVLVTVKSPQVAEVVTLARARTSRGCVMIGLQNGIGHLQLFSDSRAGLALGVTAQGATLLAPGTVRHGGSGPTLLGFLHPGTATASHRKRLAHAASLLSAAGIATEVVDNIEQRLWQKLLVNVGINGLTVLHDCPNGKLLEIEAARERLIALVKEGIRVGRAKGIDVGADPVAQTLEVCRATGANISSMLQDARRGRPTEILAINGALVAEAAKLAIPVPENELLVTEVLHKTQGPQP